MNIDPLLTRGRLAAERMMTDTCWIRRRTGVATDPTTGAVTPTWSDVYGTQATPAKCRVQDSAGSGSEQVASVDDALTAATVVSLPITATGITPGDQVVIGAATFDPDLPARVLTVVRVQAKSHATARRLWCEEVQA